MPQYEEHWMYSASGLWEPRWWRQQQNIAQPWRQVDNGLWMPDLGKQQPELLKSEQTQSQEHPVRDWDDHWMAQGQPWRQHPEIDQERQQFLLQRLQIQSDYELDSHPFNEISLTRADVEWLVHKRGQETEKRDISEEKQRQGLNLHKAILRAVDFTALPLEGANFSLAELDGANFRSAELKEANFRSAELKEANFQSAELDRADFRFAKLDGADFQFAKLDGADFWSAELDGADFWSAELDGANFESAKLKGANFGCAKLKGANFRSAELDGADFTSAKISNATFEYATIVTAQGVGPRVADVTKWDEHSLPLQEWSQVKILGDEAEAKRRRNSEGKLKHPITRFKEYFAATRAYRQIATALEGQGRKEEAEKFAYRGYVMQRKMRWWSIWQKKRAFWQPVSDGRAWLFSWLLALLSGYGYRFGRSLGWYIGILLAFAWLYLHLSQGVPAHSSIPDHLSWIDACILSISDMVGRVFFRQDVSLSDPYSGWSVLEGMIGVFMDVVLISTLTQRLFKK